MTDDTISEIGADATDIDQSVTVTDTDKAHAEQAAKAGGCPVVHGAGAGAAHPAGQPHPTTGSANNVWWPNQLNLRILKKNPAEANPLGG
ncbi:catalase-peroxidase, partial [Microbacterium sp. zg.Y909]|nr:catalase-peroxidase [Microbacterium sp. zg.Y909]